MNKVVDIFRRRIEGVVQTSARLFMRVRSSVPLFLRAFFAPCGITRQREVLWRHAALLGARLPTRWEQRRVSELRLPASPSLQ